MQTNALLHEALVDISRIARLDAEGGACADPVGEFWTVKDRLHAEFWQQAGIEGAGAPEVTDSQDHVGHAVDVDHASLHLLLARHPLSIIRDSLTLLH